jgi:hypothetical protein
MQQGLRRVSEVRRRGTRAHLLVAPVRGLLTPLLAATLVIIVVVVVGMIVIAVVAVVGLVVQSG